MTRTQDTDHARPEARADVAPASAAPPAWIVAIDVGGSGSRLVATRLTDHPETSSPDTTVQAPSPADAASDPAHADVALTGRPVAIGPHGSDVAEVVRDLCASFVSHVAAQRATPLDGPPTVVAAAVGATGIATLVPDPSAVHDALRASLSARRTAVAADAVTAHLGALGGRAGAVIAVGTGAIALGTDLAGIWRRVDGWGHLLGDLGSASWIGAHGLRAALAAHDRRATGGSRPLLETATARFGPPPTWPTQLYTRPDRAQVLGSFTPDVAAASAEGDPAATQILTEAGRHLAESLAAALAPGLPPLAAATGGVLAAGPALTGALERRFAALRPDAELVPSAGTPLDGALRLARRLVDAGPARDSGPGAPASRASLTSHEPWLSVEGTTEPGLSAAGPTDRSGLPPASRATPPPTSP
ncbi:N-acetylglucosamine kinase [Oerskovia turbata]